MERKFEKLRISVSEVCNISCQFCDGTNSEPIYNKTSSLSLSNLMSIVENIHKHTQIKEVRITGGEPTLYKDLIPLVKELKILDIPNIGLTSNAILLENKIEPLWNNGLTAINISLSSLKEEIFHQMTRRSGVAKVLRSIETIQKFPLKLKINTTIMRTINDIEILPLLEYCLERVITIRFLELMQMGPIQKHEFNTYFFSEKDILDTITSRYTIRKMPKELSSTANYWNVNNHNSLFGIIANESTPFCYDCNRLRIDSKGLLYGCLSNPNGFNVLNVDDLHTILEKAMLQKQNKFTGSTLSMREIGG